MLRQDSDPVAKCEEIITEGRVEIDGELVTELGTRVDPKHQEVRVDGSRVRVNPNHVTLALNKPKRVLSAMEDPKGRYTLSDIVGDKYDRIFHMGRLDYDSEADSHDERWRAQPARHAPQVRG